MSGNYEVALCGMIDGIKVVFFFVFCFLFLFFCFWFCSFWCMFSSEQKYARPREAV